MDKASKAWVWVFGVLAFIHAAIYAFSNPVFEAPDEPHHLEYINYVATTGRLPVQTVGARPVHYAHHFPLYYILASPISRLMAGGQVGVELETLGPQMSWPHYMHEGAQPFLNDGSRRGFYALRLLSAIFVGLAVVQIGWAARVLLPQGRVWVVAPLLAAFLPQLAFIGGSISNDALMVLFCSGATLHAVKAASEPDQKRHWLWTGVWAGLAFVTKKSALVFWPAWLVLALCCMSKARLKPLWSLLAGLLVAAPLLIRNQLTYGELLLNRTEIETLPELVFPQPLTSAHFTQHMPEEVPRSFIAHFGWMAVRMPDIVVRPWEWLVGLLLLASLLAFRNKRAQAAFLWAFALSSVFGLIYYNLTFAQAQGRLLFPSLAAVMLLCGLGAAMLSAGLQWKRKLYLLGPGVLYLFLAAWTAFDVNNNFYAQAEAALQHGEFPRNPQTPGRR